MNLSHRDRTSHTSKLIMEAYARGGTRRQREKREGEGREEEREGLKGKGRENREGWGRA